MDKEVNNSKVTIIFGNKKNDTSVPSEVISLSDKAIVTLFIKSDVLISDRKVLLSQTVLIGSIVYITVIAIYLTMRCLLNLFLHRNYLNAINRFNKLVFEKQSAIDSLSNKLDCMYKQERATKLEKEILNALFDTAALVEQMSNILLKSIEWQSNLRISDANKHKLVHAIANHAMKLRQRLIFSKQENIFNIKEQVTTAIEFLLIDIEAKNLTVLNHCEDYTTTFNIDHRFLLQIIISILSYQIFSLSKGKEIVISSFMNDEKALEIMFNDNGFGFELEKLKTHFIANAVKKSPIILNLEILEESLKEYKGSLSYIEQATGSKFIITVPLQIKNSDANEENANNLDIANIYYLNDYKK